MLFGAGAAGAVVLFAAGAAAATSAVKPRPGRPAHPLYGVPPISSRDRVYTADMASNTVSVIDPKSNKVLGTIPLGSPQLGEELGPVNRGQVGVHGLGFSRDGRLLDVISVDSNGAQLLRTQSNKLASTTSVGRSPHEGFVSPDGRTLWVAVRGQRYVSVVSTRTGREIHRIATADGPSKVVFSPDGRLAVRESPAGQEGRRARQRRLHRSGAVPR